MIKTADLHGKRGSGGQRWMMAQEEGKQSNVKKTLSKEVANIARTTTGTKEKSARLASSKWTC